MANSGILSATALPDLVSLPPPLVFPSSSPLPKSSPPCDADPGPRTSPLGPVSPSPASRIMSDRFSYPSMIPNFNNPSMLQQQQQQQQQPQQQQQQQQHPQQPQAQMQQHQQQQQDGHGNYPDQSRMWQPQMQYRPRSGMDMNQPGQQQAPQQLQDMIRARIAQNPQMGQQNQPQPQFAIGMNPAQMPPGPINPLANNQQQQPFPDANNNNNNQSQPPHFPNMGPMSNQNPGLNAAQRNPGILGIQNSGPMNRQLELMLAQQPNNGGLFNAVKQLNQQNPQLQQQVQQQQQQQQQRDQQQSQQQLQPPGINHPNADIFTSPALSSEALRRPSPSHPLQGPQQHPVSGVHHPGAQGMQLRHNLPPSMSLQDILERLKATRQALAHSEGELRQIMSQRHVPPTAELQAKVRSLQIDIKGKQEFMARLMQQQQAMMPRGGGGGGGQSWAPPNGPFDPSGNIRPPQNPQQPMHPGGQGPNGMQQNPSLQTPANNHLMAGAGVPRPGTTPNPTGPPQLGSPFVHANMANKPPFQMGGFVPGPGAANPTMPQRPGLGGAGGVGYPPPLDKAKLDSMLPGFLQKKNVKIDPAMLSVSDQQIDLAQLHQLVMMEGGFQKVNDSEAWSVIGGRMGFVSFPGSDREPSKSGPVVAQHLAHVYREYLLDIEQVYLRTYLTSNPGMRAAMNQASAGGAGPGGMQPGGGNMVNHPGAPGGAPGGGAGGPGGIPNGLTAGGNGQLQRLGPMLLQYANLSAPELRQRNIPEHIIAMVEQHRPQLQRTVMETKRFQQQVRMNVRNGPGGMVGVDMQHPNQGGPGGPGGGPPMMNTINDPNGQPGGGAHGGPGGPGAGGSNLVAAQQAMLRQQQLMKHQQHQMAAGGIDARIGGIDARIGGLPNPFVLRNPETLKMAVENVNRMKEEYKKGPQISRLMQVNVQVPYEHQADFNQLLQTLGRQTQDLSDKMHMVYLLLPNLTQRAISLCFIIHTQRQLMATGQPRYVLSLEHLRNMATEVHKIIEAFSHQQQSFLRKTQELQQMQVAAQRDRQQQAGHPPPQQPPHPPHQPPPGMQTHPNGPPPQTQLPPSAVPMHGSAQSPPNMIHGSPPLQQQQPHPPQQPMPQQQQPQQQQPPMPMLPQPQGHPIPQQQQPQAAPSPSHVQQQPPNRSINLQAPPSKRTKMPNAPTPSNTAPSPAAAATPAGTNAPTPGASAASPHSAPKSPKGKATTKKASKRKASTAPTASSSSHPPVHSQPPSVPSAPPVPQPPQAQGPQGPEPMQQQGSTSMNGSMKRAREEDGSGGNNVAPSPLGGGGIMDQPSPPKRVKMEWEGPPSEELQQRKSMVEGVKTEEDTSNFLAQMSELLKMAGSDQQQEPEFTELTNMLLKGCTQVPGAGGVDAGGLDAFVSPLDQSLMPGMKDELEQYFDFSLGGEDDDSKTPELVSSSTTNTSPGSNSGNEPTADSTTTGVSSSGSGAPTSATNNHEIKTEEPMTDFTYLGLWKEVDGGESASYQNNDWKWDNPMPSLEHPWAIFTS